MHADEIWQVFGQNGDPIAGRGVREDDVSHNSGVGIAQLWLWRKTNQGVEVLLQKRSLSKKRYPGQYGSSAGGHVNLGETFLEALKRESFEEIGAEVDVAAVIFVAELHTPLEPQSIRRVYLYEVLSSWQENLRDGEVDSVEWISLDSFKAMMADPKGYKLVDQGEAYFCILAEAVDRL